MDKIIRQIGSLDPVDRTSIERLVGSSLRDDQSVSIHVISASENPVVDQQDIRLPEWCNVFAGLSDEEIAEIDKHVSVRMDLTRGSSNQ